MHTLVLHALYAADAVLLVRYRRQQPPPSISNLALYTSDV